MSQIDKLETKVKLTVKNPSSEGGSMFGSGIAELCIGVRELGSLNAAAKRMGMAYSKAWRIIRDTESDLGLELLSRDGAHGSTLTEDGSKLLDAYLEIEASLDAMARDMLAKLFR